MGFFITILIVAVVFGLLSGAIFRAVEITLGNGVKYRPGGSMKPDRIPPMSSSEYDAFYGWGEMPPRFWPDEIQKLRKEYIEAEDSIESLRIFEDSLDDMMGITRWESMRPKVSKPRRPYPETSSTTKPPVPEAVQRYRKLKAKLGITDRD